MTYNFDKMKPGHIYLHRIDNPKEDLDLLRDALKHYEGKDITIIAVNSEPEKKFKEDYEISNTNLMYIFIGTSNGKEEAVSPGNIGDLAAKIKMFWSESKEKGKENVTLINASDMGQEFDAVKFFRDAKAFESGYKVIVSLIPEYTDEKTLVKMVRTVDGEF